MARVAFRDSTFPADERARTRGGVMSKRRTWIQIGLFLVIVAAGVGMFMGLVASKPEPKKRHKKARGAVVEVISAEVAVRQVTVEALGTVIPSRSVAVVPEVGGKVLEQHRELIPGGRIDAGQTIVRIDPREYDLAVRQAQAQVSQAELLLAQERGLKAVAEREWDQIKDEVQPTEQGRRLALREVQL